MPLELVNGDVLAQSTDAVLLTVDGLKRGLEGNVARQFERQWPDDWQLMQRDVHYPIALGRTVAVPWDGDCPWQLVLFASTLNHLEILSNRQKLEVVRSSLSEALRLCVRHGVRSLASVVLQGGWRLNSDDALQEMRAAYSMSGCPGVRLLICKNEA